MLFLRVNVKRKIQERTFNNENAILIPRTTLFSTVFVMGKDNPVSWIPQIPWISGPDIRGISVYVKSTYTEDS